MISVITANSMINITNPQVTFRIIMFIVVFLIVLLCLTILLKSIQNKPVKSLLEGINVIIPPLLVIFLIIISFKLVTFSIWISQRHIL